VDFDVTNRLVVRFSAFTRHWKKMRVMWAVLQVYMNFENSCKSFRVKFLTVFPISLENP